MIIGIDFSLNNAAMTILNNDVLKFYAFPNTQKMYTKKKEVHSDFLIYDKFDTETIATIIPYNRDNKFENYQHEQQYKLFKAHELSQNIIDVINNNIEEKCIIGLEGFSYGSKGSSQIDLVFFNAILRYKILTIKNTELIILAPKTIKRFAGNGNADKHVMLNAFKNIKNDILTETEFYKYLMSTNDYVKGKNHEIANPITDIVDSYWIIRYLKETIK